MQSSTPLTDAAVLEELSRCEARLSSIFDCNIAGVCFADLDGSVALANDAYLRMVGYSRDDLSSGRLSWREMTAHEYRHLDDHAIERMKATGTCAPFAKECTRKDGSRVPVLFGATLVSRSETELVCFSLDLTEYKQAEEKVNYFACHDALTNLPNRELFKDRLKHALLSAERNKKMLAVMLVDLDRFASINEALGYVTGDQLLREVADRMVACVRESDTVARFNGDDFALLLTEINRAEDAAKIARHIQESLSAPFNFAGQELFLTSSIGISLNPDDARDAVTLLKSAGTALNRAKELDGNHFQFYTSGRTTKALRQLVLESNLRLGLDRNEFIIHYQPQVNIQSFQLVGMEALVRWEHPALGLLHPTEFIGLAEDNGLIVPLGEWTLRTACLQSKAWQNLGFDPLRVAVNLSARQFQQPGLVELVVKILNDTGLDPYLLELELTERSIMKDPDQTIGKLHELKALGIHISVDDFGTGYSSLNYLKRFPLDTVKVDQSFVKDINIDPDNEAIVSAIITLAHALRLNVIAEGVETQAELESLRALKCDEVQGFLFSHPLPVPEFTDLLEERSSIRTSKDCTTTQLPSLLNVLEQQFS
jgi:diguanylate cyclase (GGDEF)-like protein/PAS domain S-box-containing protein